MYADTTFFFAAYSQDSEILNQCKDAFAGDNGLIVKTAYNAAEDITTVYSYKTEPVQKNFLLPTTQNFSKPLHEN